MGYCCTSNTNLIEGGHKVEVKQEGQKPNDLWNRQMPEAVLDQQWQMLLVGLLLGLPSVLLQEQEERCLQSEVFCHHDYQYHDYHVAIVAVQLMFHHHLLD